MSEIHDVVVIGSGAGGGMAAYVLAEAGVKVLMLEAGRNYDAYRETPMFQLNQDAPLRGSPTPDKAFNYYFAAVDGGWQVPGEPYTLARGSEFHWFRTRMLGGRTNHWARNSYRMGPYDFKPRSRDGLGFDWPIEYEDLAPYYDKVEALIGVYGTNSGLENQPDSPAGVLHTPPKARIGELMIKAAAEKLGMPCVPARRAVLTRPMDNRSACFYATRCGRGCSIGAAFQTTTSLLPWAVRTGNLRITTNAMVYKIDTASDGKATEIHYVDKESGEHTFVKARAIVLAASSGESARILLNSANSKFPNGLANSSGQVGRNLMDTVGSGVLAQIPSLESRPAYNEDGAMGMHMYIPFWLYPQLRKGTLDFPRGYHFELGGGFQEPDMDLSGVSRVIDGYGNRLKEDVRRYYGSFLWLIQRGEMIPNEHSFVEIDPETKDRFGIPVLKFHYKHSAYEYRQVAHSQQSAREIVERLGGNIVSGERRPEEAISAGGRVIHEVGTARMGSTAENSVVNEFGQTWDVPNLFLMDGSIFSTKSHKNPTLTILALAWRNSEYLIKQMKARQL